MAGAAVARHRGAPRGGRALRRDLDSARRLLARLGLLWVALLAQGAACQPRQGPTDWIAPEPSPQERAAPSPPEIEDPALRARLGELRADLDAGRLDAARARAEALLDSPVVAQARLLLAIVALRQGEPAEAARALEALVGDDEEAVAEAAALYRGLALAAQGRREEALAWLGERAPGGAPPALLEPGDAAAAMSLLSEARQREGRLEEALEALSWVYERGDTPARLLARSRALELTRAEPRQERLQAQLESPDDFTRGMAGAALLLRATSSPGPRALPPERLAELGELYQQVSPSLLRLQEHELAEELALRLAHAAGPRAVRLGLLLPLSGGDRRAGERALGGALIAQEVYSPHSAPRSALLLKDTGSDPEGARRGVEELVAQGATLIIGPLDQEEAAAAAQAAEARGVPLITLSLDPAVVRQGPNVFRLFWDPEGEVAALMRHARATGARRVAVLHPRLPLSTRLAEAARRLGEAEGLEVSTAIPYNADTSDFREVAKALSRSRADAVFVPDIAERVGRLLPFLAAEGLWCDAAQGDKGRALLCLGNSTWAEGRLLQDGVSYARGAVVATSYSPLAPGEANQRLVQVYRATAGGDPDLIAAFAFDALRLGRHLVLERGAGDPQGLRAALQGLEGWPGAAGPVGHRGEGELWQAPLLLTVGKEGFALWEARP